MYYTTVPSILITLVVFGVLGFTHGGAPDASMEVYSNTLASTFHITPWLMIVPVLTAILIWKKLPAIVVLALSALAAAVAALVFQPEVIRTIGQGITEGSAARVSFAGIVETIYNSVSLDTGVPEVDKLVASRGMRGMLDTIFLIIVAMCFGASMYASGMIADLSRILAPLTRTRTGLVGSTVITGSMMNGIVSDQYLSIILTSNIYRSTFEKDGYENRLLSRAVEDSATVTSPLYPWSSCGMTQATILSVPTLVYAPFCLFNILSPLMSFLVGWIGWKVVKPRS
jgi:NhaC family Na+:H+ antiporter